MESLTLKIRNHTHEAKILIVKYKGEVLQLWDFSLSGDLCPQIYKKDDSILLQKKVKDTMFKCRILFRGKNAIESCNACFSDVNNFTYEMSQNDDLNVPSVSHSLACHDDDTDTACTESPLIMSPSLLETSSPKERLSQLLTSPTQNKDEKNIPPGGDNNNIRSNLTDLRSSFTLKGNDVVILPSTSSGTNFQQVLDISPIRTTPVNVQNQGKVSQTLSPKYIKRVDPLTKKSPFLLAMKPGLQPLTHRLPVENDDILEILDPLQEHQNDGEPNSTSGSRQEHSRQTDFRNEYISASLSTIPDDDLKQMVTECLLDPQLPNIVSRIYNIIANY